MIVWKRMILGRVEIIAYSLGQHPSHVFNAEDILVVSGVVTFVATFFSRFPFWDFGFSEIGRNGQAYQLFKWSLK